MLVPAVDSSTNMAIRVVEVAFLTRLKPIMVSMMILVKFFGRRELVSLYGRKSTDN